MEYTRNSDLVEMGVNEFVKPEPVKITKPVKKSVKKSTKKK